MGHFRPRRVRAAVSEKSSRWSILVPAAIMAGLFALSEVPGEISADDPELYQLFAVVPPGVQNLLHVPAYGVLACAWVRALAAWGTAGPRAALLAFAVSAVYGVADELHQSFVPGRYPSLTDVLFDALGGALGGWLCARRAGAVAQA